MTQSTVAKLVRDVARINNLLIGLIRPARFELAASCSGVLSPNNYRALPKALESKPREDFSAFLSHAYESVTLCHNRCSKPSYVTFHVTKRTSPRGRVGERSPEKAAVSQYVRLDA